MKLCDFLTLEQTSIHPAITKKTALNHLSGLLAYGLLSIKREDIFDVLLARERLATTSIGHGIALPHARISRIHRIQLALMKLPQGVDFNSLDDLPVDIFLAILVPGQETVHHLTLLSDLANVLRDSQNAQRLRTCSSKEELFHVGMDCIKNIEIPDAIGLIEEIRLEGSLPQD